VLVTADTPENLKAVNRLPDFDELLVGEELATLPDVLGRLEKHSLLLEAAALIESMEHLHPDLRATLARACRRREPARAVEELAKILGGTRQELWRLWRSSGRAGTTPHAFIDWLLLAHAVAIRIRGESNRELAKRLHVAPATLASATKRYLKGGAKFADDDKVDPSAIIAGLREILQRTDLTRGGQI
jgi:lambda repressor-like predicted transcriptional regulator